MSSQYKSLTSESTLRFLGYNIVGNWVDLDSLANNFIWFGDDD